MKDKVVFCPSCKYDQFYRPLFGAFELKCAECGHGFNRKDIDPNISTHGGSHMICYLKAHQIKIAKSGNIKCCICFRHDCEDSDEPDFVWGQYEKTETQRQTA